MFSPRLSEKYIILYQLVKERLVQILLIDDDAVLLEMIARRLERRNFTVAQAVNLVDARKHIASSTDTHLIISDMYLANMENGLQFYYELIHTGYTGSFILTTGDDMSDSRITDLRKSHPDFTCLPKPYSSETMYTTIDLALARQQRDEK